jgi:hypothetical protein
LSFRNYSDNGLGVGVGIASGSKSNWQVVGEEAGCSYLVNQPAIVVPEATLDPDPDTDTDPDSDRVHPQGVDRDGSWHCLCEGSIGQHKVLRVVWRLAPDAFRAHRDRPRLRQGYGGQVGRGYRRDTVRPTTVAAAAGRG